MSETTGTAIGAALLATLAALIGIAKAGRIDDVALWVVRATIGTDTLRTIGAWAALLALGALLVAWSSGRRSARGQACGAACGEALNAAGASDEEMRAAIKTHEDAHQTACARAGGGGSTVRIWRDGGGWAGRTTFHDWRRVAALPPEKKIAISAAGIIAAPDTTSPNDGTHIRQYAREAPWGQRGAVTRKGKALARGWVG